MEFAPEEQVHALEQGSAFVEHADRRLVSVLGADAHRWLHDLVTADVEGLAPFEGRRTLLLTPTGRVRADLQLLGVSEEEILLLQHGAGEPIDAILAPFILSSDVEVRPSPFLAISMPNASAATPALGTLWRPSALGPGLQAIVRHEDLPEARTALYAGGFVAASEEAVETWRIRAGIPRFGADFGPDSLPSEAGLEDLIDFEKGCFLGQESVAKVRNLGHPPTLLRHLVAPVAPAGLRVGDPLYAGGEQAGVITSLAPDRGSAASVVIARIRWDARDAALGSRSGVRFGPAGRVTSA